MLYLLFGNDPKIAEKLAKIMEWTGARARAAGVLDQADLALAIEDAASWFGGKRHLFPINDMWPTDGCKEGCLPKLREMLTGNPDSRIVLTTQSAYITT